MDVILNEQEWVEENVRNLRLTKQPWTMLDRYAKYLHAQGRNKPEIRRILGEFAIRCKPNTPSAAWDEMIERSIANMKARPLICIEGVSITKAEIMLIKEQHGVQRQKVLFTLLCLAKYRNAVRGDGSSWINYDCRDVFQLANVGYSRKRQLDMYHSLYKDGLIDVSRRVDNFAIKVNIVREDSEEAVFITDFRNLGNQYLRMQSNQYIECECCGLVIRKGSNRQVYCKACAEAIKIERALDFYRERIS